MGIDIAIALTQEVFQYIATQQISGDKGIEFQLP